MAGQFPKDITYGILSKLPIKSLARFRCVCKSWLEHINDSYLETIHVKQPMPMMLEQLPSCVLPRSKNKQCRINFLNEIQSGSFEFCYKGPSYGVEENLVLGSCNGLTLVCYERDPCRGTFQVAVINPLSKECHSLPPICIKISQERYIMRWDAHEGAARIGFDDSTNTLKTVFVFFKEGVRSQDINAVQKQVCTMVHYSGRSSWSEIAEIPAYPISGEGVFGHGRLHWLVSGFDWPSVGIKIVWFDVKTEKFGLTDPPEPKGGHYQLVDLNGEVGFAYVGTCIEVWVLKQEGKWALHCRFPSPNDAVVISGCWNKDGDILLTSHGGRRGFFIYTLRTRDLRQWRENWRCEGEVRMYASSLFSIQHKSLFDYKS